MENSDGPYAGTSLREEVEGGSSCRSSRSLLCVNNLEMERGKVLYVTVCLCMFIQTAERFSFRTFVPLVKGLHASF